MDCWVSFLVALFAARGADVLASGPSGYSMPGLPRVTGILKQPLLFIDFDHGTRLSRSMLFAFASLAIPAVDQADQTDQSKSTLHPPETRSACLTNTSRCLAYRSVFRCAAAPLTALCLRCLRCPSTTIAQPDSALFQEVGGEGRRGHRQKPGSLRRVERLHEGEGTSCLALPCLALPCLALPCLALSCLVLSCLALPCHTLPCLLLSCLVLSPCDVAWRGVPCLALPCLA